MTDKRDDCDSDDGFHTFESLVAKQHKLATYIANAVENTRKLGVDKINVHVIDTRVKRIDEYFSRFEREHAILEGDYGALCGDHAYFAGEVAGETEEIWVIQRGQLLAWRDQLVVPDIKGAQVNCAPNPESVPRVKEKTRLPRLNIPIFSGQYEDWPAFRDLFVILVHED